MDRNRQLSTYMTPEEIGAAACKELSRVFSLPAEYLQTQLIRCATHDWQTDCHSCGTYSYVPAGRLETVLNLVKPVEDTLFFAGEHTDTTGHWGTVHAAMRSGPPRRRSDPCGDAILSLLFNERPNPSHQLFVTKGDYRVDARSPARRQVSCGHSCEQQKRRWPRSD